jgi:mono/diheme cytochrome c family protein
MSMKGKRTIRLAIVLLALVSPAAWLPERGAKGQGQRGAPDSFEGSVLPFLTENCVFCHNEQKKSGNLNLEVFQSTQSARANSEIWELVGEKLRTGEMPPKGLPRPPEEGRQAVLRWIEGELARSDREARPDPGRVTARRLNRAEYDNTVRDLLGVDLQPSADFPQDDSGYGFDNIGDVLSLSPVLMEKYLASAEKVARAAIFGPPRLKPTMVQRRGQGRRIVPSTVPLTDYDLTGLSLPNALHVTHRFPVAGEYVLRVILGGVRPAGSDPLQLALWIDGRQVQTRDFDPEGIASFSDDRQDFGGMTQEFRLPVTAGEHWIAVSILRMYEGLPASYKGPQPSTRVVKPLEFKPPPGAPPERVELLRQRFEARKAEKVPVNEARINTLEVRGPYEQAEGPSLESRQKIYTCGHLDGKHANGCARRIVTDLARRAYRRPVTNEEITDLLGLISAAREAGDSFEEGLCLSLQAMLVSPHFLFRLEKGRGVSASRQALGDHELASRLSYFLWSSMPDDELRRAADAGRLRDPNALAAQVRRMLRDPKSKALVENFGGQWLELRKLESVKPDRTRFPDFDEYLRLSMRRETELFFEHIVRDDRSILDFIDGDYTFLNERLAQFYGLTGVRGPEFRRVELDGTERGGVLTQASVLTVSSYATRTSPVLRGKWILENILNAPPPPAPPDVPNLDEAAVGSAASLRQQMEKHRTNPTCAACHARMDPLGFGLENFDAVGAWRTVDGKFPIDASGTLPDGRTFNGPRELRTIMKAERDVFAEGLTDKLLTYGLGRGLERYDRRTVRQIAKNVAAQDYRFSSLVLEIARSLPFQMRRGERVP